MKTVFVKSGFALGPAGSFSKFARPFRIVIEGMRLLSPAQIRNLLHNRKSMEEIKMLIEEEANPSFIYWGTMSLEGKSYRLSDVEIRSRDTETVLRAEIRWCHLVRNLRRCDGTHRDERGLWEGKRDPDHDLRNPPGKVRYPSGTRNRGRISLKISKTYLVLGLIISSVTTAFSSPVEAPPGQVQPFPEVRAPPSDHGYRLPPGGPFRAEGMALKRGDAYHLHIWLVDTKRIPPALARDLLRENRSLDEIREEIGKFGGTTTRGGMVLGEDRYAMARINQTFDENCSVLDADLVEFIDMMKSPEGRTIGHINLRICEEGALRSGDGNLTINEYGEVASYRLTFVSLPETDGNGQPAAVEGGGPWPW
jgi:hypothetical protein